MTTPTGWLCPSCGKAHGPHIATCPTDASARYAAKTASFGGIDFRMVTGYPTKVFTVVYPQTHGQQRAPQHFLPNGPRNA